MRSPVNYAVQVVYERDHPLDPQVIANVDNFDVSRTSSITLPKNDNV